MPSFDPRLPEVLEWIAGLRPEAELVVRMAMRAVYPRCRGYLAWSQRVHELLKIVAPSEEQLAEILRQSRETEKMIRKGE